MLQSTSPVAYDAPIILRANDRTVYALFELDDGCEVDLLISDAVATTLGFDELPVDQFQPFGANVAGGTPATLRRYRGVVEVSFTTGRGSIINTACANVLVGGNENLLGLPTMGRLRLGVPKDIDTKCIFPVRAAKIV